MKLLSIWIARVCFLILFIPSVAEAATYYWVGTSGNWNSRANWSSVSGGAGNAGVPGINDVAIFDVKSGDCSVNIAVQIATLQTISYTKTLTINSTLTVTNTDVNGGTINGGSLIYTGSGTGRLKNVTLGCAISGTTRILWQGIIANNTITIQTTAVSRFDDSRISGSIFVQSLTITHAAADCYLYLGAAGETNTFNGPVTLNCANSSTGPVNSEGTEVYNATFTVNNYGAPNCNPAFNSNTSYKDNVLLNNYNGWFIKIGGSTASVGLAPGKTISFRDEGTYYMENFTQQGTINPISITLTNADLGFTSCTFNADITITAHGFGLENSTLNGNSTIIVTSLLTSSGNTYNSDATVTNSGYFALYDDTYKKNLTVNQPSGRLDLAVRGYTSIGGNLVVNSNSIMTIGSVGGVLTFNGSGVQNFTNTGTTLPTFTNVTIDKPAGSLILNSPMTVRTNLTLTKGVVFSSAANILQLNTGATVTGGSIDSYIDGPVRKVGNQAFSFPTGNNGAYRAISITAPAQVTDAFTAQFFNVGQTFGDATRNTPPLRTINSCEYWTLDRTSGTSNVFVTLSWNSLNCMGSTTTDTSPLQVARWNGSNWVSHGRRNVTGTAASGTIQSSAAVSNFSPFALGSTALNNPLPITLTEFHAHVTKDLNVAIEWSTASELNNDRFEVEKSSNGVDFYVYQTVKGNGTTQKSHDYFIIDTSPFQGTGYYRLKQVDFNGARSYSEMVSVQINQESLDVFPNPTKGLLTIPFSSKQKVFDSLGQLVFEGTSPTSALNLSALPAGVYLLLLPSGPTRIVIQH